MSRRERVRQAIEEAFRDVPYPEDPRFALNPETSEGEETEKAFKGHHWRNLPEKAVSKRMLIFLRPEARHFYMPAFLLAALRRLPRAPTMFDLYSLVPPDDATRFKKEYDTYSSAQRAAIRLFLEYVRDEAARPDCKATAELALERYWESIS